MSIAKADGLLACLLLLLNLMGAYVQGKCRCASHLHTAPGMSAILHPSAPVCMSRAPPKAPAGCSFPGTPLLLH